MPYTVSYDLPAIRRLVDALEDDTINDPLFILIEAEDELEFNAEADPAPNGQHPNVEKSS